MPRGDPLFDGLADPASVVQWHWEEISRLPEGAVWLAGGDDYPHQAFRVGAAAWGVQGHPEVTADIASAWAREDSPLLLAAGRDPASLVAEVRDAEPDVDEDVAAGGDAVRGAGGRTRDGRSMTGTSVGDRDGAA